jgi:hypothetical protein
MLGHFPFSLHPFLGLELWRAEEELTNGRKRKPDRRRQASLSSSRRALEYIKIRKTKLSL